MIEYCLIAMLAILVLIRADENVIQMLFDALQQMYAAFTYAMSMTYPTPD